MEKGKGDGERRTTLVSRKQRGSRGLRGINAKRRESAGARARKVREPKRKEDGEQGRLVLKEPFWVRPLLRPPPLPYAAQGTCALVVCPWGLPSSSTCTNSERLPNTDAVAPDLPAGWLCHPALHGGAAQPTPTSCHAQSPSLIFPPSITSAHLHALTLCQRAAAVTWKAGGLVFCPAVCPWGELLPLWKPRGKGRGGGVRGAPHFLEGQAQG